MTTIDIMTGVNLCTDLKLLPERLQTVRVRGESFRTMILAMTLFMICVVGYAATGKKEIGRRPFTVADDIRLAQFDDLLSGTPPFVISPDGRLAAVRVQRGLLKQNRLDDEIRVYRLSALDKFVTEESSARSPEPVWTLRVTTYSEGMLITTMRWLHNSQGLAFLLRDNRGNYQLMLADFKHSRPHLLSLKGQDVLAFDIRNDTHYVYTVRRTHQAEQKIQQKSSASIDITGQSLIDDLFPEFATSLSDRGVLWAAVGGSPQPIMSPGGKNPIVLYDEGQRSMALSPDGTILATALPVEDVPESWGSQYQAPTKGDLYRIHAGHQSVASDTGASLVSQYVIINLRTGRSRSLATAPTGRSVHWVAGGMAQMAWAADGRSLVLPSTFIAHQAPEAEDGSPCLAIANLKKGSLQCVEQIRAPYALRGTPDPKYFFIDRLHFQNDTLSMWYRQYDQSRRIRTFRYVCGEWKQHADIAASETFEPISLSIHEGLNDPPVLMATDGRTHQFRVVWNPNRQLNSVQLGEATVYHWRDGDGHLWTGGLYVPPDYIPGRRYPLVIQTHGFTNKMFLPSGTMSTAFAARALAAAGIIVLQVRGCPVEVSETPQEAPCNVEGYKAALRTLAADGMIDPKKVGIIGFSRTCYYVIQALTTDGSDFTAASITDGVNFGYWQYLLYVDLYKSGFGRESEAIYQATPFGDGLRQWTTHSPEFNLYKVSTPLLIVAEGPASLLGMWEPYAALRCLHKPTDLLLLHTDEHILTDPAAIIASQGGSVDWFRFWLQGYEDPAYAKAGQYARWEALCKMQHAEHPNEELYCLTAKHGYTPSPTNLSGDTGLPTRSNNR